GFRALFFAGFGFLGRGRGAVLADDLGLGRGGGLGGRALRCHRLSSPKGAHAYANGAPWSPTLWCESRTDPLGTGDRTEGPDPAIQIPCFWAGGSSDGRKRPCRHRFRRILGCTARIEAKSLPELR